MSLPAQNRQPAGIPTGGQFAASAHAESGVTLTDTPGHGLDEDAWDAAVLDALGDGQVLDDTDQRLLRILTDPQVNEDCGNDTDIGVIVEEVGYNGESTDIYGAEQIAERLGAHYRMLSPDNGAGEFNLEMARTESGVESYNVGVYLGHSEGAWLTETHEVKYLDADRVHTTGESGLRKAVALARVMDDDFQRVRSRAQRLGLVPNEAPKTSTEATVRYGAAQETAKRAAAEEERAALAVAAFAVRDRWPEARHLVIAKAGDEGWNSYAHAVLDENRKPIAYPEDTFSDSRTLALQVTVMDLPVGSAKSVPSQPWNDDPDDESYVVDLNDVVTDPSMTEES